MTQLEINKKYRERHKQLGLCVSCNRKAEDGSVHCAVCLRRTRERWRLQHTVYCPECSKPLKPDERRGGRFHKLCAQKRRARMYPLKHRSAVIAYQERHRELGLCHSCSERVFEWGFCRKHYKMEQEKFYRLHAKSKRVSRQQPSVPKVKARSN